MSEHGRPTVLLVEDSEAIRTAFTILLEESGYGVVGAASGEEALELAAERGPDLVLLDLGLPRKGGLEVLRELKSAAETARIPVVAVTGQDDPAQRDACLAAGCSAFLVKPIDTQALVRSLPAFINGMKIIG